ncbi:unnamed protein product, partial [Mesorhabditis spiculigera]
MPPRPRTPESHCRTEPEASSPTGVNWDDVGEDRLGLERWQATCTNYQACIARLTELTLKGQNGVLQLEESMELCRLKSKQTHLELKYLDNVLAGLAVLRGHEAPNPNMRAIFCVYELAMAKTQEIMQRMQLDQSEKCWLKSR